MEFFIEDVIYNRDNDEREMMQGCVVRKLDEGMADRGLYVNDIVWNVTEGGSERLAVCFNDP